MESGKQIDMYLQDTVALETSESGSETAGMESDSGNEEYDSELESESEDTIEIEEEGQAPSKAKGFSRRLKSQLGLFSKIYSVR